MVPPKFPCHGNGICLAILRWEIQFCRGTNSEEVACKDEGSNKPVRSDDLESSSEKTDVNGQGISFINSTIQLLLVWEKNIFLRSLLFQHKFNGLLRKKKTVRYI